MAELRNLDSNTLITGFVSLQLQQEVIRIVHKTLDGAQHLQRIGAPTVRYALTLYVDEGGKAALLEAEDKGALLQVSVSSGIYKGRLTELSECKRLAAGWYEVSAVLAKEWEE